jgi:acetolactate synthase-1/2/3 large subunit
MAKITGGEAVVKSLIAEGVDVVFGIPSVHNVAIYDALYRHPEIKVITTRHEQGATHMADGYARVSGKPGVCITSTGPGVCNSVSGMTEAYASSSPVLNITTQNEKDISGKEKGAAHDSKDQTGMLRAATGWNKRSSQSRISLQVFMRHLEELRHGDLGPSHWNFRLISFRHGMMWSFLVRRPMKGLQVIRPR